MSTEAIYFLGAIVVGLGATLFMDLWALFLKYAFSIPLPNYCLVGRWLCHMPEGTFRHVSIAAASQKRFECTVGWIAHYILGAVYALGLVALVAPDGWESPRFQAGFWLKLGSGKVALPHPAHPRVTQGVRPPQSYIGPEPSLSLTNGP